jgi:hypothetical protein
MQTGVQGHMQRWEYWVATVRNSSQGEVEPLSNLLTDAGRQGWELVSSNQTGTLTFFVLIFKRPVS